jgi:putative SOS response-associated peptidase YedK
MTFGRVCKGRRRNPNNDADAEMAKAIFADGEPVMFAGIWDYSDVKGEAVPSFAILTDEPNELVAPYHDRMPIVLGDVERWLNLDTTLDDLNPLGPERFAVRAVNPAVNKVSEKNIDAIERAA